MSLILNGDTGISAVDGTASVPALVGNDTNTGIYFPAADTIGFSEGGVQVGEFDSSANFKFNSGYGSSAVAYGCRAWVNFDGTTNTGGFCTIRASGNVTSITDNGTGDYTVNFTTALADTNYCAVVGGCYTNNGSLERNFGPTTELFTTTTLRILSSDQTAGGGLDAEVVCVSIFR